MTEPWHDLPDDELTFRLILRGVPTGHARRIVRRRNHPAEAAEINEILSK